MCKPQRIQKSSKCKRETSRRAEGHLLEAAATLGPSSGKGVHRGSGRPRAVHRRSGEQTQRGQRDEHCQQGRRRALHVETHDCWSPAPAVFHCPKQRRAKKAQATRALSCATVLAGFVGAGCRPPAICLQRDSARAYMSTASSSCDLKPPAALRTGWDGWRHQRPN